MPIVASECLEPGSGNVARAIGFPRRPHDIKGLVDWGTKFSVAEIEKGLSYMKVRLCHRSWQVFAGERKLGRMWAHEGELFKCECAIHKRKLIKPATFLNKAVYESCRMGIPVGPNLDTLRAAERLGMLWHIAGTACHDLDEHRALAVKVQNSTRKRK